MKIHEYQAKAILAKFGVPVPRGEAALKKEHARGIAERLGTPVMVVKAQIHAGGRGKAGGVKLARSAQQADELAGQIMGMTLVTPQTGAEGRVVRRLLIEEGLDIRKELYLSILVDRTVAAPVIMASAAGGMEIEEVARENPERDSARNDFSRRWFAAVSDPQNCFWTGAARGNGGRGHAVSSVSLSRLHRNGRLAAGNQSLRGDRRRPSGGAGRQGQFRRQRALPPQGFIELRDWTRRLRSKWRPRITS